MCLAVPGKVVKRDGDLKATVDMMGIERPVSLRLVPTAQVGDYILVHAGFGIQIVDEQEAQETLELVNTMTELAEEDQLATNPAEAY
ncbi:MAG: HypC/HybG/HupF family hydrogenase formation chaperone [Collinsella sp.]|jgi:hydrogenase expression/formation protein HypC|nr:HypC/HybG/HupF family hydrogenase formation chaperone [Collinsella sp.]